MVFFEKSQPSPPCLEAEKLKANGDYKCKDVLDRIQSDFKNKCYLCEYKEPETINVEHFIPHEGNKDLMFDWNNLFWACSHCNNIKLAKYRGILNCLDPNSAIESSLKYIFKPYPFEHVNIECLNDRPETITTKDLLLAVYNGTTNLKKIESANLRNKLLNEILEFQKYLCDYFKDTNSQEDIQYFLIKIRGHLNRGSNFTAFKRWIVLENQRLREEFVRYFD